MVHALVLLLALVLLAAMLFVKEIAQMSKVTDISANRKQVKQLLPDGWQVLKISGPLFFAAADRIFADIAHLSAPSRGVVLYMDGVPLLDAGGLAALHKLISHCQRTNTELVIADLQFQPLKTLAKAGIQPIPGKLSFYPTLRKALEYLAKYGLS